MAPKNQETAVRGTTITLDVYFYSYDGGPLTDPDSTPTYTIYDPNGTATVSGSGTKSSTGLYKASWVIPGTAEISKSWYITWTASINSIAITGNTEYFEVTSSASTGIAQTATISDYWLNHVKKAIAYPSVDNIILTDDEIKSYCIYPALREYFTKFPIRSTTEHQISTSTDTDVDFPDNDTFGVIDVRIVGKTYLDGGGSSFWDLVAHNQRGIFPQRGGAYGVSRYNPGGRAQAVELSILAANSVANLATTHIRVEEENNKVVIFATSSGKANVTWAKMSEDFEDVRFVYKMDVIRLSQAYVKEQLADTAGLINTNLEVDIDSDTLRSEAKELREEIKEKWDSYPDIIIIRST